MDMPDFCAMFLMGIASMRLCILFLEAGDKI
jgi:hypothetical protein